ncbi:hypothetical protein J437_LFUL010435 [Ladona fulva]|uniref:Uncharacterized protein n=1 Tax=Ladona fulva TaxID=123851 RepID=A0A8K0P3B7_LADFU|nr:hypothetical protein J437_LFUL010435 [Ladona fulva]
MLIRIAKVRDKVSNDMTSIKQMKDESGSILQELTKILNGWNKKEMKTRELCKIFPGMESALR